MTHREQSDNLCIYKEKQFLDTIVVVYQLFSTKMMNKNELELHRPGSGQRRVSEVNSWKLLYHASSDRDKTV